MAGSLASSAYHGEHPSETSSRSLTDTVTVAHNFEITNYSLLDGIGIGQYITSSKFSAGGHDWNIRFYPDGEMEDEASYCSVYLCLCRGEPLVRVKLSMIVLDREGNTLIRRSTVAYTFDYPGRYYGYPKLFPKSMPGEKLHRLHLDDDDCFTIRCVLTVMTHRTENGSAVVLPRSNLHDHLIGMLERVEGTDVTFSVGDQLFHAHRCMLAARSPMFKAELFSGMEENATGHIKVDDMEPAIFQALLHFIYTDDCGVDKNVPLQHLFVAADRYGLERLTAVCEQRLCQSIDVHTVATTLALAEQHHCVQLKNSCLGFLSSHGVLSDIQDTDGFKHLVSSCPSVVADIINHVAVASGSGRAAKRARVEATHSDSSSSYTGD